MSASIDKTIIHEIKETRHVTKSSSNKSVDLADSKEFVEANIDEDDYTDSASEDGSSYSDSEYTSDSYSSSDEEEEEVQRGSSSSSKKDQEPSTINSSKQSIKRADNKPAPLVIKHSPSASVSPTRTTSTAFDAGRSPGRSPTAVSSPFQFQSGVLAKTPSIRYNITPNFFGSIPPSFKNGTLGKALSLGKGSYGEALFPFLDKSAVCFRNLLVEGKRHKLKPIEAQCDIAFSVLEASSIPAPGSDTLVIGRQVRIALFDKTQILSNIHTLPAIYNPESPKVWKFSASSSILFPSDDENSCFARVLQADYKLSILFELCIVASKRVAKPDGSTETIIAEISCGWGVLPLFTADGKHLKSKKYNLGMFGGTPFDSTLSLLVAPEPQTILQSIFRIDKSPRLVIQVWKLRRSQRTRLSRLPANFISFLSAIPVLSMYRRVIADKLVGPNNEPKLDTIWSPVLALAPAIMDQVDYFKIFIKQWEAERKASSRKELKSFERMAKRYEKALLSLYPLLFIREIPAFSAGDDALRHQRSRFFTKIQSDTVTTTLSSNPAKFSFRPFDSTEGAFDYLNLYSYYDSSLSINS